MTILTKEQRSDIEKRHKEHTTEYIWTFGKDAMIKFIDRIDDDRGALLASEKALREQVSELEDMLKANLDVMILKDKQLERMEQYYSEGVTYEQFKALEQDDE